MASGSHGCTQFCPTPCPAPSSHSHGQLVQRHPSTPAASTHPPKCSPLGAVHSAPITCLPCPEPPTRHLLAVASAQVVGQHDPLPTYRELMGHGSPPITLRRAARQPQQPLASSPARTNGPLPAAATTNGHGASSSPSKRSPLPLPPSQLHHATSSPAKQPGTGTIPHALGLTVGNPGAGSLAANGVGVVGGMGAGGADADQLRKQLAAVVSRVEAHQGRYEQVLLEARKAADLVRSMEAEIRWGGKVT